MKKLLNESEIRKFMKFANIGTLTDGFVERLTESEMAEEKLEERGMPMKDDDDEMEEGMRGMRKDDDEMEEGMRGMKDDDDMREGESVDEMRGMKDDDDMREGEHEGAEPAMDAMDAGEEPAGDADDTIEAEVSVEAEDVQALRKARDVIDQILAGADGDMDGMDDPMGDVDPLDAPEDELEEADIYLEEDLDEDIVSEVTRRVAARLLAAQRDQAEF